MPLLGPDGQPIALADPYPQVQKRPGMPAPPVVIPDDVLVDRLVEYGQPREHADQLRQSNDLRCYATMFYFDVEEMRRGDREARERVDRCREAWQRLNRTMEEHRRHGLG